MIISQVRNFGGALALAQGVAAHGQIGVPLEAAVHYYGPAEVSPFLYKSLHKVCT
jgi:hypothetical protein